MMQRSHAKSLIAAGLFVLAGVSAGFALGSFTTGDGAAEARSAQSPWMADDPATAPAPMLASTGVTDGPRNYVCKGCGPSLEEQRMRESYAGYGDAGAEPDGATLLPPYSALSHDGDAGAGEEDGQGIVH